MISRLLRASGAGLVWVTAGAAFLATAFEPPPPEALPPGTRVREIREQGKTWTCKVVRRTEDGRYVLAHGPVRFIAEPGTIARCE